MNSDCMGYRKNSENIQWTGEMGQCGHFFPSTSLSLSSQLLFQQLGPCPALLAKPAVSSVAQGTPAPLPPPLFTAHSPTAVTGKFSNRGGKGGGPVDNLSMHLRIYIPVTERSWNPGTQRLQSPGKPVTLLLGCPLDWALPCLLTSSHRCDRYENWSCRDVGRWPTAF